MKLLTFFTLILSFSNLYAQNGDVLRREIEKAMAYEVNMDTAKMTGWVIGCIDHDSAWVYGYGRISKTLPLKPDGNTVFEIGGLSKVFVASTLHEMAEKKLVCYDSTVNTYLKPAQRLTLA